MATFRWVSAAGKPASPQACLNAENGNREQNLQHHAEGGLEVADQRRVDLAHEHRAFDHSNENADTSCADKPGDDGTRNLQADIDMVD